MIIIIIIIITIIIIIIIIMPMPSCLQDVVREMLILRHVQKRKLRRHIKRHITEMSAAHLTGTVQCQGALFVIRPRLPTTGQLGSF